MIGAVARHVSIVTAFSGALAAIVPGILLWPNLSRGPFAPSIFRYYLIEMGTMGAIVLVAFLLRTAAAVAVVWSGCGVLTGFILAGGIHIGELYVPAAVLFGVSGLLGDFSSTAGWRVDQLRHLIIAVSAAGAQAAVMAAVVAIGG